MPRASRISPRQMDILTDFAETHQHIAIVYGTTRNQNEARKAWQSVAVKLNAAGIKKTPEQWRRYWIEYKAKLKAKAADIRRGTEGPGAKLQPLSDREQQLVELINRVAAEGLPDSYFSDLNRTKLDDSSSPPAKRPSLEAEWLDYESGSDDNIKEEQTKGSQFESDSEHILFQAVETEDEDYMEPVKRKLHTYARNTLSTSSQSEESYKKSQGCNKLSAKKGTLSETAATVSGYCNSKKCEPTKDSTDPDLLFFHSILPEMKQMNPEQKRQFKLGVWTLANQILESKSVDPLTRS